MKNSDRFTKERSQPVPWTWRRCRRPQCPMSSLLAWRRHPHSHCPSLCWSCRWGCRNPSSGFYLFQELKTSFRPLGSVSLLWREEGKESVKVLHQRDFSHFMIFGSRLIFAKLLVMIRNYVVKHQTGPLPLETWRPLYWTVQLICDWSIDFYGSFNETTQDNFLYLYLYIIFTTFRPILLVCFLCLQFTL